jgi:hypothetical protein
MPNTFDIKDRGPNLPERIDMEGLLKYKISLNTNAIDGNMLEYETAPDINLIAADIIRKMCAKKLKEINAITNKRLRPTKSEVLAIANTMYVCEQIVFQNEFTLRKYARENVDKQKALLDLMDPGKELNLAHTEAQKNYLIDNGMYNGDIIYMSRSQVAELIGSQACNKEQLEQLGMLGYDTENGATLAEYKTAFTERKEKESATQEP